MPTHVEIAQLYSHESGNHEFIFGGLANTVSVISLFPLYKTIFFQQLDGITWIQAFSRLKSEGFRLAYRGVLPPLLQRASSGSVMFGVQSVSERLLLNKPLSANLPPYATRFISSVLAGWSEASLMPFERVQTLLQNKHFFPSYRNTFHTITSLVTQHGVSELYRGLVPILLRNSGGNVLYFSGLKWLTEVRQRGSNEGPVKRSLWNFFLGGVLGGFISFYTFPLNVIKTRMQTAVGGQFRSFRSVLILLLYHRHGNRADIRRLYRGMPANLMRSVVSWGIITMTYQLLLEAYSGLAA